MRKRQTQPQRIAVRTILVAVFLEAIFAVGHIAQHVARLRFGVVEQIGEAVDDSLRAEPPHEVERAPLAGIDRGDQRLQVAPVLLGNAHIGRG